VLRLLGITLPPAVRAVIGVALVAVGVGVHLIGLALVGAVFLITALVGYAR
jgi:hypothetical protein